jgi:hypothetical protein
MQQLQNFDLSPMSAVGAALLRLILAGFWIVHWWFKVGYRGMPATEAFFRPYEDQWSFLSGVRRMSRAEVATIVEHASATGRIVGVRLPIDDDDEAPWMAPPSRRGTTLPIFGALPESVEVVLSNHFTLTGVGFRRQSSIA